MSEASAKIEQETTPESVKPAEQTISISPEMKGISREEVLRMAEESWPSIMKRLRAERGAAVVDRWGYFKQPLKPGRDHPIAYLATEGCQHAICGGCTMCDYGVGKKLPREKLIEKLRAEIEEVFPILESSNEGYQDFGAFNIIALGSFFDDEEIPPEVRELIYEKIAANKSKHDEILFTTESRLECIDEEKLKRMREMLGDDVRIEIGFGLESTDPLVREGSINKKLPPDWKEKIALLRKYNVEVAAHVMIKPPFLTEEEAINDAVETIKFLDEENLADMVIAMTMNRRPATVVGKLEEEGKYELPSIWTVLEIMRRLGPELSNKTRFLGFNLSEAEVDEVKVVKGCEGCEEEVVERLLPFTGAEGEYDDIMKAAEATHCQCRSKWQERLKKKPDSTMAERIAAGIDFLRKEYGEDE